MKQTEKFSIEIFEDCIILSGVPPSQSNLHSASALPLQIHLLSKDGVVRFLLTEKE